MNILNVAKEIFTKNSHLYVRCDSLSKSIQSFNQVYHRRTSILKELNVDHFISYKRKIKIDYTLRITNNNYSYLSYFVTNNIILIYTPDYMYLNLLTTIIHND